MHTPPSTTILTGKILIVDDAPEVLKLFNDLLIPKGYSIRLFNSGELALRSIQVEMPELILLDVRMPQMDGYEVCRRIKADEKFVHIPVIFISAAADVDDKIKGFGVGAVDYITKPFQIEEVLARINTHIALFRSRMQLEESSRAIELLVNSLRKTNVVLQETCRELNVELRDAQFDHDKLLCQLADANDAKSRVLRENTKILARMLDLHEKNLGLIRQYDTSQHRDRSQ